MPDILITVLVVFFASTLHGFVGFGYGLVIMAVLPFFIPITTATVLVSFSASFFSAYMVWRNRKNIDLRVILFPLIGIVIFIPVGVLLLNNVNNEILKSILGLILILISVFYLLKGEQKIHVKPNALNGIIAGATAGILNGWLSVGGPPLVLYFIQANRDKYSYKVAMDLVFLFNAVYRLIWLYIYGNITGAMAPLLGAAAITGILGTLIGFSLLIKFERLIINKAVYVTLLIAGLSLIILK